MDPVRYVLGLVLVGALLAAGVWLLRRLGPRASGASSVTVVSVQSVGTREKLVVLRYRGEELLVGITPAQMCCLARTPLDAEAANGDHGS